MSNHDLLSDEPISTDRYLIELITRIDLEKLFVHHKLMKYRFCFAA